MLDLTLTDDNLTTFTLFTGRPDNTDPDCCDQPADGQPLLSIADPAGSPEYICHLLCYLSNAHQRLADDD